MKWMARRKHLLQVHFTFTPRNSLSGLARLFSSLRSLPIHPLFPYYFRFSPRTSRLKQTCPWQRKFYNRTCSDTNSALARQIIIQTPCSHKMPVYLETRRLNAAAFTSSHAAVARHPIILELDNSTYHLFLHTSISWLERNTYPGVNLIVRPNIHVPS